MTRISILAALWAVLLLALFIFSTPLDEKLWFLYLPIHWGIPLAGAVILVVAIVQGIRTRRPAPVANRPRS